jgi:serine phosphatase RsbU (regulator of sigma subunit)
VSATNAPVTPEALTQRYTAAFQAWLERGDERELGLAYDLGRDAVAAQLSVLDLAGIHHDATEAALAGAPAGADLEALVRAAGVFIREALSTFELAHRAYRDAQEAARVEHEHVVALEELAAASVAVNAATSTEDALQRTAEAARTILGAAEGTVTIVADDPFARALTAVDPPVRAGLGTPGPPLAVELRTGGRAFGELAVRDDAGRAYTRRDEAVLAQLGQLASVAIANRQAYLREHHIAQILQRSLLPASLPSVPGLVAAVRFIAAGEGIEVGGDFYDFFPARAGAAAAIIGDVCGKGPEAASVTALARHTLRAAAAYETRPSAVLALLHRALRDARSDGRFCTVAYCDLEQIDEHRTRLTLACGGHPLPLVIRASGQVEPVGALGTLLGADIQPVLTDVSVELAPGELVVLYTDGVTEVRAGRREVFGFHDLTRVLEGCAGLAPDLVAQRVQAAVLEAADGPPRDDIAILVAGPAPTGPDLA